MPTPDLFPTDDGKADFQQLIDDCVARESRLSEWDRDFIDSIERRLAAGLSLSPKQSDKLDEIWERATAKG
jgi:hypothetical protein